MRRKNPDGGRVAQPFGFRRECDRLLARAPEGPGEGDDARGLPTTGQGWDGAAGEAGRLAGTRISWCCGRGCGKVWQNRCSQSNAWGRRRAWLAPGHDQRPIEKPAQWSAAPYARRLPLAGWEDGPALGHCGSAHDGTEFSQVDGLAGSLDAESHLRRRSRSARKTGGVEWSILLPLTSNDS